jgi:hypothetical protein
MPLHAQATNDQEDAAASKLAEAPAAVDSLATTVAADGAEDPDSTIHIELNFNAFADDVPPTQHARRAPSYTDPSIQDFADQALELAALRAELKRLSRDYDALLHTLQLREARLQRLQDELAAIRSRSRQPVRSVQSAGGEEQSEREVGQATDVLAAAEMSLTVDLPPRKAEAPSPRAEPARAAQPTTAPVAADRQLVPLDHEGPAVALRRDIMTIGRAKENDVCIPSRAVSRDHARLLLGPRTVTIVDMGSANGCFVNDQPVKKQTLREGDVLRVGDRSYRYSSSSGSNPGVSMSSN